MASEITNNLSSTNINGILNALLSVSENEVFVQAMKGVNIKNLTDRVNLYNETVNSLTTISNIVLDPDKLKNVLSSTQKTLDVFKGFNILTDDKNTPEVKELESLFDKTQSILNIIVEKTKEVEIQDDNSFINTNERVVDIINSIVSVSDSVKSFVENFEIPDENTIIGNIDSLRILVEYIKEGGKEIHVAEQTITNFAVTAEGVDKIISSMSSIGSSVEKLLEEKLPDAKKVKIACNGLLNIVYEIIDKVQNSDITQEAITQTSEKIKPIQEVIENFSKILGVLGSFNVLNIVGIMIYQKALDPSFEVINGILTKVNEMKVTEEMAEKLTPLKNIVDSISSIVTALVKTAMLSMVLVVMQIPLKLAIGVIADINTLITEKFAEAKDLENAAKNLGVIGNALAELAKGLLLFVTLTMFGVVPLFAIVSLLAVKLFLNVFFRLFDKDSFKQIDMSNEAIKQVTITLFMLSGLVLMWALTGILILEAWPQILTTVLFVVVAIGVFILLGHLSKYIEEGNKSLYSIAATLIILSLTVLL